MSNFRKLWPGVASERASEPRERSAPAQRRARERVGESEGRSPSDKKRRRRPQRKAAADANRLMPGRKAAASVETVMRQLEGAIDGLELPAVEKISETQKENAFHVLISTMLSARTQDATTLAASTRLFEAAATPAAMAALTVRQIERLIYPVSFYRHKARHVKATCRLLLERFGGAVPSTMEELLLLPGVGRKTANLVLILGFKSGRNICVDTHVHRISNRLGWVRTSTPAAVLPLAQRYFLF